MSDYNGWTNYETWNAALWLANDGTIDNMIDDIDEDSDDKAEELADMLESFVDEFTPDIGNNMYSDMLNASLREVNWREIAENNLS